MNKKRLHYHELYKLSKSGKPQVYMLYIVDDQTPTLISEKGFMEGTMQVDEELFTQGKNLGRANETTPMEQAIITLNSKKNKLLDKGYKQIPPGKDVMDYLTSTKGTDASGGLKPMLAQKNTKKITFPGFIQRKYDGVRCFTFLINGNVKKVSRNGKYFEHLDHLDNELTDLVEADPGGLGYRDWIIDGELYSDELSFQNIISAVKREQASNTSIGYRIYDMIPINNLSMVQKDRMKTIRYCRREFGQSGIFKYLEFAQTFRVNSFEKFLELFSKFIQEGYEGAMFRDTTGIYGFGERSYSLIKYKEFDEAEFEILGVEEATGRDIGTAVFILKTPDGKVFRARPMGTREQRKDYFNNISQYIGLKGTVKYQGLSDEGIPRFPVFKAIRDYE